MYKKILALFGAIHAASKPQAVLRVTCDDFKGSWEGVDRGNYLAVEGIGTGALVLGANATFFSRSLRDNTLLSFDIDEYQCRENSDGLASLEIRHTSERISSRINMQINPDDVNKVMASGGIRKESYPRDIAVFNGNMSRSM